MKREKLYSVSGAVILPNYFDEGLTVQIIVPANNKQHASRRVRRMFPDFVITKVERQ